MASKFASCTLLLFTALLFLQCGCGIGAQISSEKRIYVWEKVDDVAKITDIHQKMSKFDMDLSYNVWFRPKDLHKGFTMLVYFAKTDPAHSPHFLSREESDSIPFSLSHLDYLLSRFSISKNTPQAKAIHYTLSNCDIKSEGHHGIMSCISSLESMLDLVQEAFGLDTKFENFTSTTHSSETSPLLQKYTFIKDPQQLSASKMVACHPMPYPYAVFYCHGHFDGSTKVFKIPLQGENGDRVEGVAVCHASTSNWDEDHISFKMLDMKPRSGPVCHFIPHNNFVWLPSN